MPMGADVFELQVIYTIMRPWDTTTAHTSTPSSKWLHRGPRTRLQSANCPLYAGSEVLDDSQYMG